jgi:hypothetical protein
MQRIGWRIGFGLAALLGALSLASCASGNAGGKNANVAAGGSAGDGAAASVSGGAGGAASQGGAAGDTATFPTGMAQTGRKFAHFVTRKGGQLFEGDEPFRFMGLAAPNLHQNEGQWLADLSNRFPDEYEIRDNLETFAQIGARATRTFVLSVYSDTDQLPVFIRGLSKRSTPPAASAVPADFDVRSEAEAGTLSGGAQVATTTAGYSGTGYVTGMVGKDAQIILKLNAPVTATYLLAIGYAAPYGDKATSLELNSSGPQNASLPGTKTFKEAYLRATLQAGENTVVLRTGWGYYDIDYVRARPAAPPTGEPYGEDAFRALDRILALCPEYDVRLIIPFIDSHSFRSWRGIDEFAAFRGKPGKDFFTDDELKQDFKNLILDVLNRRNTVSGLLYKDDPAILAWQLGNELSSYHPDRGTQSAETDAALTAWTLEMARFLKEQAPHHLVMEAGGDQDAYAKSDDIDIISKHYYEYWSKLGGGSGKIDEYLRSDAQRFKGKKALIADEFGMSSTDLLSRFMEGVVDSEVAGALLWGVRGHRRDGGFYYHNESGTKYNSYHWPGFPGGDSYDEREVLTLLRQSAYAVRGESEPARPLPYPPPLLFPVEKKRALRFRGSTGAEGYLIERAESAAGPWTVIAENAPDAIIPGNQVAAFISKEEPAPRPLFTDAQADATKVYYYRVTPKNREGLGQPSNVVKSEP